MNASNNAIPKFSEKTVSETIARPRLHQPVPEFCPAIGAAVGCTLQEDELRAMTSNGLSISERKVQHYRSLGLEVGWLMEWAKNIGGAGWCATCRSMTSCTRRILNILIQRRLVGSSKVWMNSLPTILHF